MVVSISIQSSVTFEMKAVKEVVVEDAVAPSNTLLAIKRGQENEKKLVEAPAVVPRRLPLPGELIEPRLPTEWPNQKLKPMLKETRRKADLFRAAC